MGVTNRGLESPDETRTFEHGQVQVVKIGETTIGRYTFEPGWRWSESIKPIAKTDEDAPAHGLAEGLSEHQVQVQHGPGRKTSLWNQERAIQALQVKRG